MAKQTKGKDFERKYYAAITSEDSEKSFRNGIHSVENDKEMKAFYAGVGYGKHQYNEPLGFEHDDQREAFKRGVAARKRHLTAYEGPRKQGLLERFFRSLTQQRKKRKSERRKKGSAAERSSSDSPRMIRVGHKVENGTQKRLSRSRTVGTAGAAHKTSTGKKRYRVKK